MRSYAPKNLYKWYYSYMKGGFDALIPSGMNDCGKPRKLDGNLKARIAYMKEHYPRMGAASIFRQMRDDASRLVTGAGVFFEDTFANLMSVMKGAMAKYGAPRMFNFDNGSAYKNRQMELLAARIGAAVNYCRPYTPTAKAKILYDTFFYPHLIRKPLSLLNILVR